MLRLAQFAPRSFPALAVLAGAAAVACGDDAGQTSSPIGIACEPSRCGPVPDHTCANGQPSPIECLRVEDGHCAWEVTSCADGTGGGDGAGPGSTSGRGSEAGAGGASAIGSGGPGADKDVGPAVPGGSSAGAGGLDAAPAAGMGGPLAGAGSMAEREGDGRAGPLSGRGGPGGTRRCGTRGGQACGEDQFCNSDGDPACGATDRGGMCEPRPEECPDIDDPVCGCDERTYDNACSAHREGVSVRHPGDCDAGQGSKQTCGGIAALDCGDGGEFCNFEESAGGEGCDGSVADAAGVCEPRPMGCTRELSPVCSCDRHSFNNTCLAHAEGLSVRHEGGCDEDDCEALGGHVVLATGAAAMCASNERRHTYLFSVGGMSVEGAICCVP